MATVEVGDDEPQVGSVGFANSAVTVAEGDGSARLVVIMSKPYSYPLPVWTTTTDGTAVSGEDYLAILDDLVIPALAQEVPVAVGIVDDDELEEAETFEMRLSPAVRLQRFENSRATITITASDAPPPTASVTAGGAIIEGETATFTVELSEPAVGDVEVGFVLEEIERVGSWVNSDLVPDAAEGAASVTIRAGQSSAVVSVATHADGVHEDSAARYGRTNPLTLSIQPGSGYVVGNPSVATVEVGDDEPQVGSVGFANSAVTVAEGDGSARLVVIMSKPYSYPLPVWTTTTDGTAVSGEDYLAILDDLVIPALAQEVPVAVGIVDDDELEEAETFEMRLSPAVRLQRFENSRATITITASDAPPPTASVTAGGAIIEGETATFTVELSEPAVGDVEVGFVLEEIERVGSWVNSDLVPDAAEGAASVTIRAGQSSAVVSVATHADGVHEDSAARYGRTNPLTLSIQPGSGYVVGNPSVATVEVGDDEPQVGSVGFANSAVTVAEGDGSARLVVIMSKPYSYPLPVWTTTTDGTAVSGEDYLAILDDLVIPALAQEVPVAVGIVDDDELEEAETFEMRLSPAVRLQRFENSRATITITASDR